MEGRANSRDIERARLDETKSGSPILMPTTIVRKRSWTC